ncbi:MAG: Crp/Fnr family transcriptional regulator [Peptoniphilus sp.]|nr:Crp/Fnr family transcriptional regulator [Peptoniphilus sp.]
MNYFFLSRTEIFYGISEEEIKSVLLCLQSYEKDYDNKEIIYRAGNHISEIGLVERGSVNIEEYDYWGNKSILGNIKTGDIFGLSYAALPGVPLQSDVVANEDCRILFMNIERILTVCPMACPYHTEFIRNMFRVAAKKNILIHQRMKHISAKSIRDKLISYLSEQSLKQGSPQFTIAFNRKQLSEYLGVDRSALSNELSKMQRDGMLTYKKNTFTLKNLEY